MLFNLQWSGQVTGVFVSWRRHQIKTFSALLALCEENTPVIGGFLWQRPVRGSFDIFFDLRLNEWLSKHRAAGDLRRHPSHYDGTVMCCSIDAYNSLILTKRHALFVCHQPHIIQFEDSRNWRTMSSQELVPKTLFHRPPVNILLCNSLALNAAISFVYSCNLVLGNK